MLRGADGQRNMSKAEGRASVVSLDDHGKSI